MEISAEEAAVPTCGMGSAFIAQHATATSPRICIKMLSVVRTMGVTSTHLDAKETNADEAVKRMLVMGTDFIAWTVMAICPAT